MGKHMDVCKRFSMSEWAEKVQVVVQQYPSNHAFVLFEGQSVNKNSVFLGVINESPPFQNLTLAVTHTNFYLVVWHELATTTWNVIISFHQHPPIAICLHIDKSIMS